MNWFLGWPWPRGFSRIVRKLNTLAVFTVPVMIWWAFAVGFDRLHFSLGGSIILALLWVLCLVGLGIAPMVQISYWMLPRRSHVLSNDSQIVDLSGQLGYKPIGRGKRRHLAGLPKNEIFHVEFAERHVQIPHLPEALDGLTILHLSDLHFRGTPDKAFFQAVMDRCNEWHPDIVAVTGDIVDSWQHLRWVVPVLGRLRWKIAAFAIRGNHDQWYDPGLVRRRLRKLRMEVVGNCWHKMDIRGEPVVIIGHEGPWFTPGPDVSNCPDGFRLCLSHTPDNIAWAREHQVNLMLSGHNHGGQIRFPLIGSVYVPSKYGRRYDCGTFDENPTVLHVTRGLSGQYPVRFFCKPEVALLVLHRYNSC